MAIFSRKGMRVKAAALAILVVAAVTVCALWWGGDEAPPTATVQRGALVVTVEEPGELWVANHTIVNNPVDQRVLIKSIVPDGKIVEPGEMILELEAAGLTDQVNQQKLVVEDARSKLLKEKDRCAVEASEDARALLAARAEVEEAAAKLQRYEQLECRTRQLELQDKLELARHEAMLKQSELEFKQEANTNPALIESPPYSRKELSRLAVEVQKAQLAVDEAANALNLFNTYEQAMQLRKLADELAEARGELALREAESAEHGRLATVTLAHLELALETPQKRQAQLEVALARLTVAADHRAIVTHASRFSVGDQVNMGRSILILNEMGSELVRMRVYEAKAAAIRPGQPVRVTLESMPGAPLSGSVLRVDRVASVTDGYNSPGVRSQYVYVKLDQPGQSLKPGMKAQVKVEVQRRENALLAPVQAVHHDDQGYWAWCWRRGKAQRLAVRLGLVGTEQVEIQDGLREGDRVLLDEPQGGDDA